MEMEEAKVKELSGQLSACPRPKIPVLTFTEIASAHAPQTKIKVRVMLDTGCDVSLVSPNTIKRLDEALRRERVNDATLLDSLPIERSIKFFDPCIKEGNSLVDDYYDEDDDRYYAPAFDLLLFLTQKNAYRSSYGFLRPDGWKFENFDIWLGRDILNQLIITFDGANETVTIKDPN
jgi:hypothetical protein